MTQVSNHIVIIADKRERFLVEESLPNVSIIIKDGLTFSSAFEIIRGCIYYKKQTIFIILSGLKSLFHWIKNPSCLSNNCPSPNYIYVGISEETSLIDEAVSLQNTFYQGTDKDELILCEIIPLQQNLYFISKSAMCNHHPNNNHPCTKYTKKSISEIYLFNQWIRSSYSSNNYEIYPKLKKFQLNLKSCDINNLNLNETIGISPILRPKRLSQMKSLVSYFLNSSGDTDVIDDEKEFAHDRYDKIIIVANSAYKPALRYVNSLKTTILADDDDVNFENISSFISRYAYIARGQTLWIIVSGIFLIATVHQHCYRTCFEPLYKIDPTYIHWKEVLNYISAVKLKLHSILDKNSSIVFAPLIPGQIMSSNIDHFMQHSLHKSSNNLFCVDEHQMQKLTDYYNHICKDWLEFSSVTFQQARISDKSLVKFSSLMKGRFIKQLTPHSLVDVSAPSKCWNNFMNILIREVTKTKTNYPVSSTSGKLVSVASAECVNSKEKLKEMKSRTRNTKLLQHIQEKQKNVEINTPKGYIDFDSPCKNSSLVISQIRKFDHIMFIGPRILWKKLKRLFPFGSFIDENLCFLDLRRVHNICKGVSRFHGNALILILLDITVIAEKIDFEDNHRINLALRNSEASPEDLVDKSLQDISTSLNLLQNNAPANSVVLVSPICSNIGLWLNPSLTSNQTSFCITRSDKSDFFFLHGLYTSWTQALHLLKEKWKVFMFDIFEKAKLDLSCFEEYLNQQEYIIHVFRDLDTLLQNTKDNVSEWAMYIKKYCRTFALYDETKKTTNFCGTADSFSHFMESESFEASVEDLRKAIIDAKRKRKRKRLHSVENANNVVKMPIISIATVNKEEFDQGETIRASSPQEDKLASAFQPIKINYTSEIVRTVTYKERDLRKAIIDAKIKRKRKMLHSVKNANNVEEMPINSIATVNKEEFDQGETIRAGSLQEDKLASAFQPIKINYTSEIVRTVTYKEGDHDIEQLKIEKPIKESTFASTALSYKESTFASAALSYEISANDGETSINNVHLDIKTEQPDLKTGNNTIINLGKSVSSVVSQECKSNRKISIKDLVVDIKTEKHEVENKCTTKFTVDPKSVSAVAFQFNGDAEIPLNDFIDGIKPERSDMSDVKTSNFIIEPKSPSAVASQERKSVHDLEMSANDLVVDIKTEKHDVEDVNATEKHDVVDGNANKCVKSKSISSVVSQGNRSISNLEIHSNNVVAVATTNTHDSDEATLVKKSVSVSISQSKSTIKEDFVTFRNNELNLEHINNNTILQERGKKSSFVKFTVKSGCNLSQLISAKKLLNTDNSSTLCTDGGDVNISKKVGIQRCVKKTKINQTDHLIGNGNFVTTNLDYKNVKNHYLALMGPKSYWRISVKKILELHFWAMILKNSFTFHIFWHKPLKYFPSSQLIVPLEWKFLSKFFSTLQAKNIIDNRILSERKSKWHLSSLIISCSRVEIFPPKEVEVLDSEIQVVIEYKRGVSKKKSPANSLKRKLEDQRPLIVDVVTQRAENEANPKKFKHCDSQMKEASNNSSKNVGNQNESPNKDFGAIFLMHYNAQQTSCTEKEENDLNSDSTLKDASTFLSTNPPCITLDEDSPVLNDDEPVSTSLTNLADLSFVSSDDESVILVDSSSEVDEPVSSIQVTNKPDNTIRNPEGVKVKLCYYSPYTQKFMKDLALACGCTEEPLEEGDGYIFKMLDETWAAIFVKVFDGKRIYNSKLSAFLVKDSINRKKIPVKNSSEFEKTLLRLLDAHVSSLVDVIQPKFVRAFDIRTFKTLKCCKKYCSDKRSCHYFHSEEDRRRCWRGLHKQYNASMCPVRQEGLICPWKDNCSASHNLIENNFHISVFKKEICDIEPTERSHDYQLCSSVHPGTPDSFYHPGWKDIFVEGIDQSLDYLVGSIRMMYQVHLQEGPTVLFLSPSINFIEFARRVISPIAELHHVNVLLPKENERVSLKEVASAHLLMGTPDAMWNILCYYSADVFRTVRAVVVDDISTVVSSSSQYMLFIGILDALHSRETKDDLLNLVLTSENTEENIVKACAKIFETSFTVIKATKGVSERLPPLNVTQKRSSDSFTPSQTKKYRRDSSGDRGVVVIVKDASNKAAATSYSPRVLDSQENFPRVSSEAIDHLLLDARNKSASVKSREQYVRTLDAESFSDECNSFLKANQHYMTTSGGKMHYDPEMEKKYHIFSNKYKKFYDEEGSADHFRTLWFEFWKAHKDNINHENTSIAHCRSVENKRTVGSTVKNKRGVGSTAGCYENQNKDVLTSYSIPEDLNLAKGISRKKSLDTVNKNFSDEPCSSKALCKSNTKVASSVRNENTVTDSYSSTSRTENLQGKERAVSREEEPIPEEVKSRNRKVVEMENALLSLNGKLQAQFPDLSKMFSSAVSTFDKSVSVKENVVKIFQREEYQHLLQIICDEFEVLRTACRNKLRRRTYSKAMQDCKIIQDFIERNKNLYL